jgi:hypothetical protein
MLPGTWRLEGRRAGLVGEDAGIVLSVLVPAGDLAESDLRAPPPLPPERQGGMEGAPGAQGRRALWPAIALLAGALMLAEGLSVSALGATSAREDAAPRLRAKKGALGWLAARRSRRGTG